MRFAIGVLVTTAAIASYHWAVYRADRELAPAAARGRDRGSCCSSARPTPRSRGRWPRAPTAGCRRGRAPTTGWRTWSVDEVMTALAGTTADEVIVLSDAGGLRAIPVHRG